MTTQTNKQTQDTAAPLDLAQFDCTTAAEWGRIVRALESNMTVQSLAIGAREEASLLLSEIRTLRARNAELVEVLERATLRVQLANSEGDPILRAWLPDALAAIEESSAKEGRAEG
jgi:hypothetical protein